jgi:DNA repair protein SbcC/Rad50
MSDIQYIIHTADLHIGKGITINRENEFKSVFTEFSERVHKYNPNNSIIVIAGDIFDRKDNLTAYEISLFDYLINSLSKYEVIIIPGNHDGIVNNPTRMDLLSPLVKHHSNIIYLRDTTTFTHRGVTFVHVSVYDQSGPEEILKLIQGAPSKPVLLYHGAINGCKFNNYIESNSRITSEIQDNCKAVIAGDIHEMQFIGRGNVAYSGSLLQHEVDESHDKGFILWDMNECKNGKVSVPNEYRQYKLDLNKLSINDIKDLNCAKNIHKVNVIMDSEGAAEEKLTAVREKFGRIDNVCKVSKLPQTCGRSQSELLQQLLMNEKATPDEIESILKIHSELTTVQPVRKWYIKSVKFDNMYKYGANNHINFDIYSGDIIGVIANNQAGKSTILDVIMFGLFNVLMRGGTKNKINHYAKNTRIEIVFCVNGLTYTIERTDYMSCKSHKLSCGTENITEKSVSETYNKIKSLIGTHTEFLATSMYYDNSQDIIRMTSTARKYLFASLFGVYEKKTLIDTIRGWIAECNEKILKYGKRPRTEDEIRNEMAQNIVEVENISSQLGAYEGSYTQYENILKGHKCRSLSAINADIEHDMKAATECKNIIDNLSEKITESCIDAPAASGDKEKLLSLVGDYPPSNVLRREVELLSKEVCKSINKPTRGIQEIQNDIASLQCDVEQSQILSTIMTQEESKRQLKGKISAANAAILAAENNYNSSKKLQESLLESSKLQYNPTCEQCKNNMIVTNADLVHATNEVKTREENLHKIRGELQSEIQKYESELSIVENSTSQLLRKHNLEQELENAHKYSASIKVQERMSELQNTLQLSITSENAARQLKAIHMYEQSQLNKQLITARQKLNIAKARLTGLARELETAKEFNHAAYTLAAEEAPKLRQKIFELGSSRAVLKHKYTELIGELENSKKYYSETPELYRKIHIYELYKKCIDVKGLITLIVKENMAAIVDRINHILSQLTTFRIEHSADDTDISFDIIETTSEDSSNATMAKKYTYDIDVASGFQKFIVSLVMRLVLSYALPTSCQCMFIDEGFTCMDKNNIEKLHDLFNMLKQEYKYIFIISHLQEIQNIIERKIDIQKHSSNEKQSYVTNVIAPKLPLVAQNTAIVPQMAASGAKNNPICALVISKENPVTAFTPIVPQTQPQAVDDSFMVCECGMQLKKRSKYMHLKTKKHIDMMAKIGPVRK